MDKSDASHSWEFRRKRTREEFEQSLEQDLFDVEEPTDVEPEEVEYVRPENPSYIEMPPPTYQTENVPYPENWKPDTLIATHLMLHERYVQGTHVMSKYTVLLLRKSSPVPQQLNRKAAANLGAVQKYCKRVAKLTDETLMHYVNRFHQNPQLTSLVQSPIVQRPTKTLYELGDYLALTCSVENRCINCNKLMIAANGKRAFNPNNFRFRACCYDGVNFKPLEPTSLSQVDKVYPFFYDLETVPNAQGIHSIYMGFVLVPEELRGIYPNEDDDGFIEVKTSLEIVNIVRTAVQIVKQRQVADVRAYGQTTMASIQIVSFNGARFDDTFLAQDWRNYVYEEFGGMEPFTKKKKFENDGPQLMYSERGGALTFNTLEVDSTLEVRWTDLLRFVPPTSLGNLARSFKLEEEKGEIPFEALNAFVLQGPEAVVRNPEDGFLDCKTYYNDDVVKREKSLAYYLKVLPEELRTPRKDMYWWCRAYCRQDVNVLALAYHFLNNLYTTYLKHLAVLSPYEPNEHFDFKPMTMHSLATMAGKLMLSSAVGSTVWGYDSEENKVEYVTPGKDEGWYLGSPRGSTYDFCRQALAGGWVKNYYQGVIVDNNVAPQEMVECLRVLKEKHEMNLHENLAHDMTDIASMYPVAVTYPMPVGSCHWVEHEVDRLALLTKCLDEPDPCKVPKFFARGKMTAPRKPLFSESTLPQRRELDNALRWTYWDDQTGTRVICSLDLWVACRDHTGSGPDTYWTMTACDAMLYFPKSAQIYRPFMEACAKLKEDGSREKNELKRTVGKIGMNSGIGKLGQQVDAKANILGTKDMLDFLEQHGRNARLAGHQQATFENKRTRQKETMPEYQVAIKDADKNKWPIHQAVFMYASTRVMRLNWSLATRPKETINTCVKNLPFPDTIYGDTDSKLLPTTHSKLMPPEMIGATVGVYKPELDNNLLTRPFFQVEPEKVSTPPFISCVSGVLASKKYFVWGYDPNTGKQSLKFKCNGLTRFNEEKHKCPLHETGRCQECKSMCMHGMYAFECLICVLRLLSTECMTRENDAIWVSGEKYKYRVDQLRCLTLIDFTRVLITGVTCKIISVNFERTLSIATSKLPSFSIRTSDQSRALNRPRLLQAEHEIRNDRPFGKFVPYISGCAQLNSESGILVPSGNYLF